MPSPMTLLEGLFPAEISCVYSDVYPEHFSLLAAEQSATGDMAPQRLREFIHGRSCARLALQNLGYPDCPVAVGKDRAPVWPDQVVGSISHCGHSAAAVAGHRDHTSGLGIDLEEREALDAALLPMICRAEELARLAGNDLDQLLAKLIFSAKESLFKCVWPEVRRFIDFQEVEIRLDMDANSFAATARNDSLPADLFGKVRGRFGQTRDLFVTAAYFG